MKRILQMIFPRRLAASPLNAAAAVGLTVAILLPVTIERPAAAQGSVAAPARDDAAILRAEAEAFNGYPRLLSYIAARQVSASEAEAADIATLREMLDGYREIHDEVGPLARTGDRAKAAEVARLAMMVLDEVRGSIKLIGTRTIGTDGTTPATAETSTPLAVAARQ